MSRKFLFEIEEDVLRLDDKRVEAFRKAYIEEADLLRMIKMEDPFQMVNGRLHFFSKEERDKTVVEYIMSQRKHLRKYGGMNLVGLKNIKDRVVDVFPEVAITYQFVEDEIKKENCPDCVLSQKYQKVFDHMKSLSDGRDLSKLEGSFPALTLRFLKKEELKDEDLKVEVPLYVSKVDIPFIDTDKMVLEDFDPSLDFATRKECWDCVKKHLSEAIVLMSECIMGYGADKYEQKWEMIGHLSQAAKECAKVNLKLADKIRAFRIKIMRQKPEVVANA